MINMSPEINKLAEALSKAQAEIEPAIKEKENPYFKSHYADFTAVRKACQGPLSKNNIAVTQLTHENEKGLFIVTMLMHASGQWIAGELPVRPIKNDPQGIGSAITYMKRYGLQSIVGIGTEDDDGEAAMARSHNGGSKHHHEPVKDKHAITKEEQHHLVSLIQSKGINDRKEVSKILFDLTGKITTSELNKTDLLKVVDFFTNLTDTQVQQFPFEGDR